MLIHKKIITCIKEKNDHDFEPFISFEFYPPKTEKAIQTLKEKLKRLKHQSPLYIDFTWAAGGSSSDLTVELSKFAAELGFEVNMHLTCTNMDIDKISTALKDAKKFDIKNICALRGDPPIGSDNWISGSSGFLNALDLINYINSEYPNYFGIQVAGYPEGHPDKIHPVGIKELSKTEKSRIANVEIKIEEVKDMKNIHPSSLYVKNKINQDLNPSIINPAALSLFCNTKKKSYSSKWVPHVCSDNDYQEDIAYLKRKVDAGADMIISQLFYDENVFIQWVKDCRLKGIKCPIIPGIMPIFKRETFYRMTKFCKTRVPKVILDDLEKFDSDDSSGIRDYGVKLGIKMCLKLIQSGIIGLHFYTMNMEKSTLDILEGMNLKCNG